MRVSLWSLANHAQKIALLNWLWYSEINDNFNIFKPPSEITFIIFIDHINIARNPWLMHVENGASNCYVLKNVSTRPSHLENNFSNRSTSCHINVPHQNSEAIYSHFYKRLSILNHAMILQSTYWSLVPSNYFQQSLAMHLI